MEMPNWPCVPFHGFRCGFRVSLDGPDWPKNVAFWISDRLKQCRAASLRDFPGLSGVSEPLRMLLGFF
eukprot:1062669-Alexandrium_andersonii.AAC.1